MDERQIEDYLRRFRPCSPAPLPHRPRRWNLVALGTAAVLAIATLLQLPPAPAGSSEQHPITIGSANQLFARSPSWKEAIDQSGFAFRTRQAGDAPPGGSALEILSQQELPQ